MCPDILAEKRWPTRQELDQAAPNNPVYIRSIWGFWRGTFPIVSCANTEALKRAGITRDTASPVKSLTIEKDGNGDPTGVFVEQEMQPITELIWFREATRFSHADRMKALQESQRLYHAVGTTGIFEGHGAAGELIRVYKETHRDGALSMRTTLAFSPDWLAAGKAPLGPFVDSWAAWLGEPALGDDRLKMSGVYLSLGQPPAGNLRTAAAGSYTGWAGFNYTSGLPRAQLKEVLVRCAANDIRVVMNGPPVLDLYDEVDREVPLKGKRWVIAHINDFSPQGRRAHRAHGTGAHHPHQQLSLQRPARARQAAAAGAPRRDRPAAQPARRRREGVAGDRQRADHELPAGLADHPAHELRDQAAGRAAAGAHAHGGAALRHRRRRLSDVRRGQARHACRPESLPTSPCSAPTR